MTSIAERRELSKRHIEKPRRGDYWHEMFVPQCVVLDVIGDEIVICKETKTVGLDHWTWDLDKFETHHKSWLHEEFKYGCIPGYWAMVSPEAHLWASEEYGPNPGKWNHRQIDHGDIMGDNYSRAMFEAQQS